MCYFDLGGGEGAHQSTFPPDLRFCFINRPVVVLSHWDCDHWVVAAEREPAALRSVWVVPDQFIGPRALLLALTIEYSGGRLMVWPLTLPHLAFGPVEIGQCTGSSVNESGLAMKFNSFRGPVLLPGDCGYEHIPLWNGAPATRVLSLAVPHHGGKTSPLKSRAVPAPLGRFWQKVVYSYGKPNNHGHARKDVKRAHCRAGWGILAMKQTGLLRSPKGLGHVLLSPRLRGRCRTCSLCQLQPHH